MAATLEATPFPDGHTYTRLMPTQTSDPLARSWSLCPECSRTVACAYEARGDEVWQVKTCPEHGTFEAVNWHAVEHWEWTQSFDDGCCEGACDPAGDDQRRRCLAVVDVTMNCNLACNWCYASSRPGLADVPVEEVRGMLETVLRESGGPTPLQFSGGEPTTRADLPLLVRMARDMGFSNIEVNSNGINLGRDPELAARLKEAGVVAVYLQFDGFGPEAYKGIRDSTDLTPVKLQAIENCRAAGLHVILVPMVVPGVNDDQLGDIIRFALDHLDVVRGVSIQPVSHFGRSKRDTEHLSLPKVAQMVADQTGFLRQADFFQVPCCGPQCSSATMLLRLPGQKGKAIALTRFLSEAAYKDVVAELDKRRLVDALAGTKAGVQATKDAALCCGITVPPGAEKLAPRMLAVSMTGFMDADTVDLQRLARCCINVPTREGRLVPFCGYNLTDRHGRYELRRQYAARAAAPPSPDALPVVP